MGAWHSPGSIYNLGHAAIKSLFTVPVQIQEKVDGSFFAFGYFPEGEKPNKERIPYDIKIRSKAAMMATEAPQKMFSPAAKAVLDRKDLLVPGWQYRGETLAKPNHNALAYGRVPKDNVILFDILTDEEAYLPYPELKAEADRLQLEVVPQLYTGMVSDANELRKLLETTSILGGQLIEGMVIKPLQPLYGLDKKLLMGKFVSEAFREVHKKAWGESNPKSGDILSTLGNIYGTQARWQKALQRLREAGKIIDAPQDIGLLMHEVAPDIKKECEDEIKEYLFKWAWPHIARCSARGLPEWYKQLLLTQQFEKEMPTGE